MLQSPNINGLYEYSFATHEWQILPQNGLPIDFIYLQIVILKQNLIVHGMKQYEINRNVYRIFMGNFQYIIFTTTIMYIITRK